MASVDTPSQPPPSTIDSASANNTPSITNGGAGERASVLAPGTVGVQRTTLDSSGVPGAAPSEGQAEVRCELEGFKRCSDSHLWKLMMSFYDRKGIDSWSQGVVPHFITCNAFIGRSYAKVQSKHLSAHFFVRNILVDSFLLLDFLRARPFLEAMGVSGASLY